MENKIRILFVSTKFDKANPTGGSLVSSHIEEALSLDARLDTLYIPLYESIGTKIWHMLRFYGSGMTPRYRKSLHTLLTTKHYDVVFMNGSRFGKIVPGLRKRFPDTRVVTFYHNVEYNFIKGLLRTKKNPLHLFTLWVIYFNERRATKASSRLIALNPRDSQELHNLYGRPADTLLPLSLKDRYRPQPVEERSDRRKTGAFIGSFFYANYYGFKWFAEHVAPHIDADILLVGRGFEKCRTEFAACSNIKVIGSVDDIDAIYHKADFIVAPIFDGSGMKTKTAEALMFGKTIFGTSEAFEGYDLDFERVGGLCNDAETFISAINSYQPQPGINEYSRQVFLDRFSFEQFRTVLAQAVASSCSEASPAQGGAGR